MPGAKRKLDYFDPNKSDSNDTDFDPTEARPRKSAKNPRSKRSGQGPRKRTKYRGSDVSDDDDDDSELDQESFSESEEEEDFEMNEKTGRAVRKATKKSVNYEEDSDSDIADLVGEDESDEDVKPKRGKNKRSRNVAPSDEDDSDAAIEEKKSKIIKLKLTPRPPARSTRAGSAARTTRGGASAEPTSAGLGTRRSTRARTEDNDDIVELSNSGRHAIRASRSPEPIGRGRPTRAAKGMKQPASTIQEEANEASQHEQEVYNTEMRTEVAGTDDQDEPDEPPLVQSDLVPEPDVGEASANEGEGQATEVVDEDDSDDIPVTRAGRTRNPRAGGVEPLDEAAESTPAEEAAAPRRLTRGSKRKKRKTGGAEQSSDFEPIEDASEDELSASDSGAKASNKDIDDEYDTSPVRRGRGRGAAQTKSKSTSRRRDSEEPELDHDELAEELEDLKSGRKRRPRRNDPDIVYETMGRRERKPVDYSIKPMDQIYAADEDAEDAAPTPTRRARGGRSGASQPWERNLLTTYGPFGGGGGAGSLIGGPWGTGAAGNVDSDSSDDENMQRPSHVGGNVGMTPTSAVPPGLLPGLGQMNNPDPTAALGGNPANLGKVKSQKALADADPLGVDQNVDFSKIGGLEGHIDQLKEMVQMPLLYPELFLKFHVTPPRGVLFHGPPGTGKTLLARALAASVGSGGRKITFYMRKGADALSKWVGEAERQLRLLFEEARKTQPSIIFFDEIDGLAPVRSSKQEQIHASIVSTLLALMDGMDGRGQVIVIGATNRPDNIDPALRRPGRFDREFYFPLPDLEARKSILNIHTKDWGIDDAFKTSLAHVTKGYGGADLRALCTEAALNSMQRTYPQIYSSNEKLIVDPEKIKITAKDFMLSVKKMIPSSERSTSSGAAPLPKLVEPLLRYQLKAIEKIVDGLIPIKKKTTALQEAMFEQYEDADGGFGRETLQQDFEKSRVFRPRLLICGEPGMGQAYLGGGLLNHFEGLHVQSFDLPTIFNDSARSAETAIVQLFSEVKRHKPSVIYLPGIDTWYHTVSEPVITTFLGLLRAIPPTDPVLVLGIADAPHDKLDPVMIRDLFGFSRKNSYTIQRPSRQTRQEFFSNIIKYVKTAPKDFPEPLNRKLRKLEVLEVAPPPPQKPPTKEEIKALKKRDHQILNLLKIQIQPIMDQINKKYKKFRTPVIAQSQIQYLFDEQSPNFVRPDIPQFRPFEVAKDKNGIEGLIETASGKFFYNLETTTIEERLSNGYYARAKDFLADIKSLAKDSKNIGDKARTLQANELLANVEVDIAVIEASPVFADCENVHQRQTERAKEAAEKQKKKTATGLGADPFAPSTHQASASSSEQTSGALTLGVAIPSSRLNIVSTPPRPLGGLSNGGHLHTGNGNSVPSRGSGEDIQMGGTDEAGASQGMQPPNQQWPRMPPGVSNLSAHATGGPSTQVSQRSAFQEISHDASPAAMINDASTTTSGKKTSDGWSTQATNGVSHPDSSPVDRPPGDSQLPDTQGNSSQNDTQIEGNSNSDGSWPHSQAHALLRGALPSQTPSSGHSYSQNPAVPPFPTAPRLVSTKPASMANILNDSPIEPTSSQISSQKELVEADAMFTDNLLRQLVEGSSGCSVEQLEQINRELMEKLWGLRGEYNRNLVATKLINVFNETILDIEEMQRVLQASQPSQIHS
ncbi:hypothetical protein B0O99DRAFT_740804 [Bisporella sp. PMI_857]|nr:hypothetical protein B0O99DRAFT_740804 [Bisporella sp. PMI_857]